MPCSRNCKDLAKAHTHTCTLRWKIISHVWRHQSHQQPNARQLGTGSGGAECRNHAVGATWNCTHTHLLSLPHRYDICVCARVCVSVCRRACTCQSACSDCARERAGTTNPSSEIPAQVFVYVCMQRTCVCLYICCV
jgi:hypothetical protein